MVEVSNYEKLEKEFEEKVKKLRQECEHKELTGWISYIDETTYLYNQTIETKYCENCRKIRKKRTKCPQCDGYIDKRTWIRALVTEVNKGILFNEFKGIARQGYALFCNNEKCIKDFIESKKKKYEIYIETFKR